MKVTSRRGAVARDVLIAVVGGLFSGLVTVGVGWLFFWRSARDLMRRTSLVLDALLEAGAITGPVRDEHGSVTGFTQTIRPESIESAEAFGTDPPRGE
jgi:hypothetical protein